MKCQHCEKPATFHITELTQPGGPSSLHLCEDHARVYLSQGNQESPVSALANLLAKQLKMEQTAQQLSDVDQKTCPACGITFAEFRQGGGLAADTITSISSKTSNHCCSISMARKHMSEKGQLELRVSGSATRVTAAS